MSSGGDFSHNQTIIMNDVWGEPEQDQSTIYFDPNNSSIADSTLDQAYITAIGSDDTQYLSIAGSNDVTLEDLHDMALGGSEIGSKEETTELQAVDTADNVLVFTVDGSDDLYGIQLTTDVAGNVHKYQFKFRTSASGQLEPIPETAILLPSEEAIVSDNISETGNDLVTNSNEQSEDFENVYIKGEVHSPCSLETFGTSESMQTDIHTGSTESSIKSTERQSSQTDTEETEKDMSDRQLLQQLISSNCPLEVEYDTDLEPDRAKTDNESDEDKFCCNDDEELNCEQLQQIIHDYAVQQFEEPSLASAYPTGYGQLKVLKDQTLKFEPDFKAKKFCRSGENYVVKREKENVASVAVNNKVRPQFMLSKVTKSNRPNPRSVLRTSFLKQKGEKKEKHPSANDCDLYHKRFAKNKDALRAKHFNNFLNRTTVPQAPIRRQRQPRKQEIKPVNERKNEEIIVQEVIVSAGNFVESLNRGNKQKKLQVTAIVELSDSEDESIAGTNQAETNVIEITSDSEDWIKSGTQKSHFHKKKRGRPPKSQSALVAGKTEIRCPFCPKSFPSQNSLNTHKIHHNLENRLKRKKMTSKPMMLEYKHKCDECLQTFKNTILLQKHACNEKKRLTCSVCLKQFGDIATLNTHKKNHLKSNLIANTSTVEITQKKVPKRTSIGHKFQCSQCQRVCESDGQLSIHMKSHRKFSCNTCGSSFNSKLLLDNHQTTKCVKINQTLKRSTVNTNKLTTSPSNQTSAITKSGKKSALPLNLNCDKCSMKFVAFRSLYMHKVQEHGMSTPDKSLVMPGTKPKRALFKMRPAYGGIPATQRMNQAFAGLRKTLAEAKDLDVF